MRNLFRALAMLASVALGALVVSQATTASTAAVSVAASLLVLAIAMRIVSVTANARKVTVGSRAREHREVLTHLPAPAHPDTTGRTRSRAPSTGVLAT